MALESRTFHALHADRGDLLGLSALEGGFCGDLLFAPLMYPDMEIEALAVVQKMEASKERRPGQGQEKRPMIGIALMTQRNVCILTLVT
jgi:hypothetical protein